MLEQNGIVFIDEMDVTSRSGVAAQSVSSGEFSRFSPLVENPLYYKYGDVKTDHILFIASGAFHLSKPLI
jgi:ATP-dependent HslUV protease ATP-binding subunit HslU